RLHTFQACAFDHSATSPHIRYRTKTWPCRPLLGRSPQPGNSAATHCKYPVRIGRHYSQDALLGNRYLRDWQYIVDAPPASGANAAIA
ncbi:hypothetical protein, partial [Hoeflea sp.]|uniref:hypothetical protein n=1 Tax=Hoeflea sp. TaxID=1940281 RepID=UPI002AFEC327